MTFKPDYPKSKSKSWQVRDLHGYIVAHRHEDDDYWGGGGNGDNDINHKLLNFDDYARTHLEEDLPNWTDDQLYIFANAIRRGDDYNRASAILLMRQYCFALIINLVDETTLTDFLDDLDFIRTTETLPVTVLIPLRDRLDQFKTTSSYKDYYRQFYDQKIRSLGEWLGEKIQEASR